MSFISVAAGQPIRATHVQQFTSWLTAQKLDTPGTIACTSTSEYALTVRSQEGTTGMALSVQYGSSGAPTTLAYFTKDETRLSSNDGSKYLSVNNTGVTINGTSPGGFSNPFTSAALLVGTGSAAAPGLAASGATGSGLYWPTLTSVALRTNTQASLILEGASAGQRMYLFDATHAATIFQVNRGSGTADGVRPDTSYTPALAAYSFHDATAGTFEAIKGFAYAAEGTGGFHVGVSGIAESTSDGSWTPGAGVNGIIGMYGQGTSYRQSSRVWGANIRALAQTTAASALVGTEIGVEVSSSATLQDRYGIIVATLENGNASGSNEDVGLKFANKNTSAANRWAEAVISFSSSDDGTGDGWPAQSGAALIKAYAPVSVTAAYGVDFDGVSFGTAAFRSTGFLVNGAGRMGVRVAGVDGTAPLRMDCTGDTHWMVLDNVASLTQTSVGAAGTASALPANPTGYLMIKVGSTEAVMPYYAKS